MFGHNEIVGMKFFKNMPQDTLNITSVFTTIQGEGPFSGMNAVFVRLAKCNLACSFCDTFFDVGTDMTFAVLEAKINQSVDDFYRSVSTPRIPNSAFVLVLTGGEPSLQPNLMKFIEYIQSGSSAFKFTQIESNGIIEFDLPRFDSTTDEIRTTLVISPKCLEKDGHPIRYLKPNIKNLERANCLKFVFSSDSESPYNTIPQWAFDWKLATGREIYISPMNVYNSEPQKSKDLRAKNANITLDERSTVDEVISFWEPGLLNLAANEQNHKEAAIFCMKYNLKFQLQVHLYASLA